MAAQHLQMVPMKTAVFWWMGLPVRPVILENGQLAVMLADEEDARNMSLRLAGAEHERSDELARRRFDE